MHIAMLKLPCTMRALRQWTDDNVKGVPASSDVPSWVPEEVERLNDMADGEWRMTREKLLFLIATLHAIGCNPSLQKTVMELLVLKQEDASYIIFDPMNSRIGLDSAHPYIAQRN